jgi:hypothetical protein
VKRAGAILFVALLVASVVVAGVVVRARTPKLEIEVLHLPLKFSPNANGHRDVAHIRFFARDSDPDAAVQVVGPNREVVRTLYRGPLTADEPISLTWNGRTTTGRVANPVDRYRLRVILPSQNRDMVFPQQMRLVGVPPR